MTTTPATLTAVRQKDIEQHRGTVRLGLFGNEVNQVMDALESAEGAVLAVRGGVSSGLVEARHVARVHAVNVLGVSIVECLAQLKELDDSVQSGGARPLTREVARGPRWHDRFTPRLSKYAIEPNGFCAHCELGLLFTPPSSSEPKKVQCPTCRKVTAFQQCPDCIATIYFGGTCANCAPQRPETRCVESHGNPKGAHDPATAEVEKLRHLLERMEITKARADIAIQRWGERLQVHEQAHKMANTLKLAQRACSRAKEDLQDGVGSADHVKAAEERFATATKEWEAAERDLQRVRNAGYPELQGTQMFLSREGSLQRVPHVSIDKLTPKIKIGTGSFANVYALTLPGAGKVAFKDFQLCSNKEELAHEADQMWSVKHENVVEVLGVCLDDGMMGLVLELMEGGSVAQLAVRPLERNRCLHIAQDVLRGLAFIHAKGKVHLDIKGDNIILQGGVAKISDFGMMKLQRPTLHATRVGFTRWTAPEVLKSQITCAADLWSFGLLLVEMVTGKIPYEGLDDANAILSISKGKPPVLHDIEPFFMGLIGACCVADPLKRPPAAELLRRVEDELKEECVICLDKVEASGGVFCENKTHFRCLGCLEDKINEKLAQGTDVRTDGGLECSPCGGIVLLEAMRAHLSAAVFARWNAAQLLSREKALSKQYEAQLAQLRDQVMDAVKRHVRHCREVISNTLCPRCRVAIAYEGGCLAITCKSCGCGFCGFCMEDQGADAHTHCAGCGYNSINRQIFPPKGRNAIEFFAEIQQARVNRQIEQYLANLPQDVAVKVRDELKKK